MVAPEDHGTFEAQWRARANVEARAPPEEAAPLTEAGTAMHESDDGPALKKADRLPSPHFDSGQAKTIRTIVIIPDRSLLAVGAKEKRLGPSADRNQ
jgi:hypothetical protein